MKNINSIKYTNYTLVYPVPDILAELDWTNILSRPPENNSNTTLKEIEEVSRETRKLSSSNKILVYNIDENPNWLLYSFLEKQNITFPFSYFASIYSTIRPVLLNVKYLYNRPRPYDLAEFFDIPINLIQTETHHTPSYPSGHTVYTSLACEIIKKQYDSSKLHTDLDNIVQNTAQCRIMQGVHYRSDNEASLKLTSILYNHIYSKMENKYYG